jgi:hypothetical protein
MIVDGVLHAYNFDPSNGANERYSPRFARGTYSHHQMWSPKNSAYQLTESEFMRDWDEEDTAAAGGPPAPPARGGGGGGAPTDKDRQDL